MPTHDHQLKPRGTVGGHIVYLFHLFIHRVRRAIRERKTTNELIWFEWKTLNLGISWNIQCLRISCSSLFFVRFSFVVTIGNTSYRIQIYSQVSVWVRQKGSKLYDMSRQMECCKFSSGFVRVIGVDSPFAPSPKSALWRARGYQHLARQLSSFIDSTIVIRGALSAIGPSPMPYEACLTPLTYFNFSILFRFIFIVVIHVLGFRFLCSTSLSYA